MSATAQLPPVTKKKKTTNSTAKPKVLKKKKTGGTITSETRSPEERARAELGVHEYHGATLHHHGDPKKAKRGVVAMLLLNQLELIDDFNPRTNSGSIEELSASIKSEGVLSSLVVRPGGKEGKFEIIAGERRYRAMKSIAYKEPIPVLIRPDLVGDDDRALAVAMAENSEDGRSDLNMIETGRGVQRLEKAGWSVAKIAKETSLHPQRVRRALALVAAPEEVQANVAAGSWSVAAGLEYMRLDPKTRASIKDKLSQVTTEADIKKYRKAAEKEEQAAKAAKGQPTAKTTKKGKPSTKPAVHVWRSSREKTTTLQELCWTLEHAEKKEIGTSGYHEIRGVISALLWDRGDRTIPVPPDLEPEKGSEDFAAVMKDLTTFNATVHAEGAKYTPKEDGEATETEGESAGE